MKRIYIAENLADAHILCSHLGEHGIQGHVFNEFSHGAVGELPFTHTWPEVWVKHDRDEARALDIVQEYSADESHLSDISCSHCQQPNPANFELCWNCSAELPKNP